MKSRRTLRGKLRYRPTKVRLFITNVQDPRYPFITNPARMHLISDIPDPAAYFAKDRTRWAAVNENDPYSQKIISQTGLFLIEGGRTYGENDICHPSHGGKVAPLMPGVTSITFGINFPTTELLVQPPAIVAVPHLEVGKPLSYDRYEGCIYTNTNAYP